MNRVVVALAVLAAVVLAGCGSKCGPSNCNGCCDSSGTCQAPSQLTCGLGGAICQTCVGVQLCQGGACMSPGGNTGGGNGSGTTSSGSSTTTSGASSGSTTTSGSAGTTTGTTTTGTSTTGGSTSGATTTGGSSGTTGAVGSPSVALVVDRSGSMADSPDGTQTQVCPAAGQQNLNCKWDEALSVLTGDSSPSAGFVGQLEAKFPSPDPARLALVTFSGFTADGGYGIQNMCATGVLQQSLSALDSVSAVVSVNDLLLQIPPNGGTPTAASLGVAASALSSNPSGHPAYVVLLTDGAPNCNGGLQATQANCDPSSDRCLSQGACYGQTNAPWGCLDDASTVSVISGLSQDRVKVFVLGFGADVLGSTSATYQTLDAMAVAGGAPRTDASGNPVEPRFYPASNRTDLQSSLAAILAQIQ